MTGVQISLKLGHPGDLIGIGDVVAASLQGQEGQSHGIDLAPGLIIGRWAGERSSGVLTGLV